jgi:hypothetical protein
MPAITYKEWGGGLDRRIPLSVQEADRLWVLKNAYITAGKKIAKRPGLRKIATGLNGSFGLENLNGVLCVFSQTGSGYNPPAGVGRVELTPYDPLALGSELRDVIYAKMFEGFPYVVAVHFGYAPADIPAVPPSIIPEPVEPPPAPPPPGSPPDPWVPPFVPPLGPGENIP